MKFSLLMSLYNRTVAAELEACLDSVVCQIPSPDQFVIVYDGPVSEQCRMLIERLSDRNNVTTVELPANMGLGTALEAGLKECEHAVVARMDSDDVAVSNRFLLQTEFLQDNPEVSALGGALREAYEDRKGSLFLVRAVPLDHESILKAARLRNPVNHPTVMFRKDDVDAAGGYLHMPLLEDYYLWVRMLVNGCKFANLPEILVEANADSGYFSRRGGKEYFLSECELTRKFREIGFHSRLDSVVFLALRILFRFLPVSIRARYYPKVLRKPA